MVTPALQIQDLRKTFKKDEVVKGIEFEIRAGEIFGLLGPNGAGKSTTINMITGVTRIGSGKIAVFGHDVEKDFSITRRLVGVMHQEIITDPFFKIGQALKIHSGYFGVKDDPDWRGLIIDRLALRPHLEKHMNRLSGGMKRRFMFAKALIHKPKLVILDEPTAGVDVELRRALWEFVREINQLGTTILLTTHHLEEAEELCERVAIMNHGRMIALDETTKLTTQLDRKKLRMKLDQRLNNVPPMIVSYPYEILEGGGVLSLELPKTVSTGEIVHRLQESGINVTDIETHSVSLEDVFLNLTKGSSP